MLSAEQKLEDEPVYNGSIRFYVRGSGDFTDLIIFENATTPSKTNFYNGRLSKPVPYEGRLRYGLFREGPLRDGEPTYKLAGEVELNLSSNDTLILVIPNPGYRENGDEQLEFLLFECDFSFQALPWDHVAFWNLTGAELIGVIGDDTQRILDGSNDAISIIPYIEQRNTRLAISLRYAGQTNRLLGTTRNFYGDRRMLFVILPPSDPDSLLVEVFRIMEINRSSLVGAVE